MISVTAFIPQPISFSEATNNYYSFHLVTRRLFRQVLEYIYKICHTINDPAVLICKKVYQIAKERSNYFEFHKRTGFFCLL